MELIVTEVTNMHNGLVCVGGWCAEEGRMVRPLSAPHEHWSATLADTSLFQVGNIIAVVPSSRGAGRGLPHAREDCVLALQPARIGCVAAARLPAALVLTESPSVEALFGACLIESRLIMAGSDCPSLGSIQTHAKRLGFLEKSKLDGTLQLRCWLYDESNAYFNLPVSSRALQSMHAAKGLDAVNALKDGMQRAHVRIGLAHPFPDGRAFAMVNHVLYF